MIASLLGSLFSWDPMMYWFICPFIFFWREGRQSNQPLLDGYCKAESGFCRPVVMLDLTACNPGKFGFDRILTGVLQYIRLEQMVQGGL